MAQQNNIELKGLFANMQKQMIASLTTNREYIEHASSKGDALENVWIEWFRNYLPNRYSVDKAIVIDSEGNTSDQLDVVIYDKHFTPFVLNQNGIKYVPAEGVYAVFEVKPDINGSSPDEGKSVHNTLYAANKVASVRRLKRTSVMIINAGREQKARHLTEIIGGLLGNTNSAKKKSTMENHLNGINGTGKLDLICGLDTGSIQLKYSNSYKAPAPGSSQSEFIKGIKDYYENRLLNGFVYSQPQNSLIFFFLKLTEHLQQRIGSVAAINFNAYLESTI